MKYQENIREYLEMEIKTLEALDVDMIDRGMREIEAAYRREGTIYIFGNGGSGSTASHYTNDFNKGLSENLEKKFRFVCLNENIPTVLAVANDFGYEEVYRYQLRGRLRPGDLVIGISGSGNSKNVLNAIAYAKEQGVRTMGIVGYDGGELKRMADVSLHVPVMNMQLSEDVHMIFDHLMMTVFAKAWEKTIK